MFHKTAETSRTEEGLIQWNRAELVHMGYAADMQEALQKFPRNIVNGYSPILTEIGSTH